MLSENATRTRTPEPSRDLSVTYQGKAVVGRPGNGPNVPARDPCTAANDCASNSFNHFVRLYEQRLWNGETKSLCDLEVDNKLERGRL